MNRYLKYAVYGLAAVALITACVMFGSTLNPS